MKIITKIKHRIKMYLQNKLRKILAPHFDRFETKSREIDENLFSFSEAVDEKISEQAEKQFLIEEKQSELSQKHSLIEEKQSELSQKHSFIEEKQSELTQKYSLVEKQQEELSQKHSLIEEKQSELSQKHSLIEEKQSELSQKHSIVEKQQEELTKKVQNIATNDEKLLTGLGTRFDAIENHLRLGSKNATEDRIFLQQLAAFNKFSPKEAQKKRQLAEIPQIDYFQFENRFRGSENLIKERQKIYLPFFQKCQKLLDIGCGRGEFLEACAQNKIKAQGIDIDDNMIHYCEQKKLSVKKIDVFDFLLESADNTFDGIFCAQVIEHLPFVAMQKLCWLINKKIKKGSLILLETINPLCPQANQHFYTDLSHFKPIFPDVLKFILENYEFKIEKTIFSTKILEKMENFTEDPSMAYLYGDYAILAVKK